MYIHSHTLSDAPPAQATTLLDDLKKHVAEKGESQVERRIEEERQRLGRTLVIIAENHSAATRSADLVRRLMKNDVYRYIASEFFVNSGPLRIKIRNFMRGLSRSLDHLLCQYEGLLLDLKRKPKYMLFVGPRATGTDIRDRRIAHHFMKELADRKLNKLTPGILVCGMGHGARMPRDDQQKTTRQWLEEHGLNILSAKVVTDDIDRATRRYYNRDLRIDTVWPTNETQTESNAIHLLDLVTGTSEYLVIPTQNSPFERVTDVWNGFSSVSIADRYEFVVLAKSMPRCKPGAIT
jgi:hypothetical protein